MKFTLLQPIGINDEKLNELVQPLEDQGYKIDINTKSMNTDEEVISILEDTEILMLVNTVLNETILNKCKNLKMISVAFTAFDQIDLEECTKNKIVVSNSAGYSTNSVAELTIGMIISLLRKLPQCDTLTRDGKTRDGVLGSELSGKTVGIIGTGTIGLQVASVLKAFGCKLLGYSRTERQEALDLGIEYVEFGKLLEQSDIVTVHTPLNTETNNLLTEEELSFMKSSAFLINTARGQIINSEDLYKALSNNKIAGAGLDVFDIEPPLNTDNPILKLENVILAPHIAFYTKEALELRADIAFKNIYKWLEGNPQNVVNE